MRHRLRRTKLNMNSTRRKALLRNMCISLIEHEQIKTTLAKAKMLRSFIEPLITSARNIDVRLDLRRKLLSILFNPKAVKKLALLASRYKSRPGGYTRIIKSGFRTGDRAPVAYIELLDRDTSIKGQALSIQSRIKSENMRSADGKS